MLPYTQKKYIRTYSLRNQMSAIFDQINAHDSALQTLNIHSQRSTIDISRMEDRLAVLESAVAHLLIRVALKEEEAERLRVDAANSQASVRMSPEPCLAPPRTTSKRWSLVERLAPTANRLKRVLSRTNRASLKARVRAAMGTPVPEVQDDSVMTH